MSLYFNETEADAEVNRVMAKHKNHVKELKMFIRNNDGVICEVVAFETVSRDDLINDIEATKEVLAVSEARLAEYDALNNESVATDVVEAPVAPVDPQTPAQPETPVDQPVAPSEPVQDAEEQAPIIVQ